MADSVKRQFRVIMPKRVAYGTRLLVNGVEIENVVGVEVENNARLDDLVTSRITISLAGEAVLVEGEGQSL